MMESKHSPIIEVIDEEYLIPQLMRRRRIAVLLPHDYYQSGSHHYPVLYLHDGQNLFDDHAPFGNWGVKNTLTKMSEAGLSDIIIVAIDHGGQHRIQEYLPYPNVKYTDHQGDLYLHFMMDTLKPMIEDRYRVKRGREYTGIGGSSMGGLISLYAGFNHNDVFGKMLVFSPSLWLSELVYQQASKFHPVGKTDIYLYAGGEESSSHHHNVRKLESLLRGQKRLYHDLEIKFSFNPFGKHQEQFWGNEFPHALRWLYFQHLYYRETTR